jgi:hypothetical protein
MSDPRQRIRQPKKTLSAPLTAAAVAVQGEIACLDTSTGKLNVVGTSTTLVPIGYFESGATGDGTTEVNVDLFDGIMLHYFENDSAPNAVALTDRGNVCYLKDGRTVSALSTGRSVAGMVFTVDATRGGVGVLFGLPLKGATGDSFGVAQSVADRAALKAVAAGDRAAGMVVLVRSDGSLWRFVPTRSSSSCPMPAPVAGSAPTSRSPRRSRSRSAWTTAR